MARARRPSRASARGAGASARSQRAESERPAASRRASAAAAQRKSAQAQAAETEEAAAAVTSGPHTSAGTQEALEPNNAPTAAAKPARAQSSSRRATAQSGNKRSSSRRATAQSERKPATARAGGARSSRRNAEVDPSTGLKQKLTYAIIGVLLLVVVGGLLAWPGIRREMILSDLDAAADAAQAQAIADDFLAYVQHNQGHVQGAINTERGPASARIHLAQQIGSIPLLLAIGANPAVSDDDRAAALEAAAVLLDDGGESAAYLDQDLLQGWAIQNERDEKHPDLAMAAAHLIAALKTENGPEVLASVIRDADQHPAILDAAVTHIPSVINSKNVGFALVLVTCPNNDAVLANPNLLQSITTSVRAQHVDRIFELLDHEDEMVQAAGARFLSGNGIASAGRDQAESIGQRISPYLTVDMRQAKPAVFSEALKVVSALSLTGARDQLFVLLPEIDPASDEATLLAQILGRNFIRNDKEVATQAISNQVLDGLSKALANPKSRATAAAALQQVKVRELDGLRVALEACIAAGADQACMDAAHHIANELYQRTDVTKKLGRDLAGWRNFLENDRPRFEEYQGIKAWIGEHAEVRVTDPPEKIKQGKIDCDRYTSLLGGWLEPGGDPMPLGLTKAMVQSTMGTLKTVQYSLMKATPGL